MKTNVPTYELYGDHPSAGDDFWIHCEAIFTRSSRFHWEIDVHRHESFHQIFLVLSGSGDATFEDGIVRIEPPAIVTIPANVSHGFRYSSDTDGLVFTILSRRVMAATGLLASSPALTAGRVTPLDAAGDAGAHLVDILSRLAAEVSTQERHKAEMMEGYLAVAYALIARLAGTDRTQGLPATRQDELMQRFLALLYRNMRGERSVAFYARALGISETHLNRVVGKVAGKSTQALIAERLLEEAKRELLFSAATVQEVAFRLGFADAAYFSRFFSRNAGATPKAWREGERGLLAAENGGD